MSILRGKKVDAHAVAVGQAAGLVLLAFFIPKDAIFWVFGVTFGTWVGFTVRGYLDRKGILR